MPYELDYVMIAVGGFILFGLILRVAFRPKGRRSRFADRPHAVKQRQW